MKLAIIGTGYWGSKIVETAKKLNLTVSQYDINDRLDELVPGNTDGVIIATPAQTHMTITKLVLRKGINVLVEKPAFMNMAEYNEIEPYTKLGKFMAGHILLYSEHFDFMKQTVCDKNIRHIESRRLNWGRLQKDITPILHYAPHDIAVLDALLQKMPNELFCKGFSMSNQKQPDYVYCDLKYDDITVHLQMGWYYHKKIRDIAITTELGTYIWNDVTNKSRFISQLIENDRQIQHLDKDLNFIETETSLERQIKAFIEYCENNKLPISNLAHTKRVTYIIECMEKSLKTNEVICPSKEY